MIKVGSIALLLVFLYGCGQPAEDVQEAAGTDVPVEDLVYAVEQGYWLGSLNIGEENHIPFNLEVIGDSVYFINAEERIGSVVQQKEELLYIQMPIFDSEFIFSKTDNGLFGFWHNYAKGDGYKIDFSAVKTELNESNRFKISSELATEMYDGKWETHFSPNTEDAYAAIGLLNQNKQNVTGTFLTETGDYRFLQGNVVGDSLYLSCFDGSHAFLFRAKLSEDTINGMFYSGSHWQEPWMAVRNDVFELRDPFTLTELKEGEELEFTFPDVNGINKSYPDPKYTDKVVIIQILGSWCPNCMDETKFLTDLYDVYNEDGLEIIGLTFEVPEKFEDKVARVEELKAHFNSNYEFLIAGNANKKEAAELIPALNHIMSFPTTIYIDRDGVVRRIHTGFYGPGTGPYYLKYVEGTRRFVEELLKES